MINPESSGKQSPTVNDYMHRDIKTISVDATLKEVGQAFADHHVSALLVKDEDQFVGIVSDKRLAREGTAKGLNPDTTSVQTIMREHLLTIEEEQLVRVAQSRDKSVTQRDEPCCSSNLN